MISATGGRSCCTVPPVTRIGNRFGAAKRRRRATDPESENPGRANGGSLDAHHIAAQNHDRLGHRVRRRRRSAGRAPTTPISKSATTGAKAAPDPQDRCLISARPPRRCRPPISDSGQHADKGSKPAGTPAPPGSISARLARSYGRASASASKRLKARRATRSSGPGPTRAACSSDRPESAGFRRPWPAYGARRDFRRPDSPIIRASCRTDVACAGADIERPCGCPARGACRPATRRRRRRHERNRGFARRRHGY